MSDFLFCTSSIRLCSTKYFQNNTLYFLATRYLQNNVPHHYQKMRVYHHPTSNLFECAKVKIITSRSSQTVDTNMRIKNSGEAYELDARKFILEICDLYSHSLVKWHFTKRFFNISVVLWKIWALADVRFVLIPYKRSQLWFLKILNMKAECQINSMFWCEF